MPSPTYLSVAEAASELGISPWEMAQLADSGSIKSVTLIDAQSLRDYQQETQ